tara:strand:+ start:393 stop:1679 length:1287 start_codon:yes stop_codon:yes gene_type:complete
MINTIYYLSLIFLSLIFIFLCLKERIFLKTPINFVYCVSFIFLNIFGSFFIFFPESNLLSDYSIYKTQSSSLNIFFALLLIQLLSFILFLPIHLKNNRIYNELSLDRVISYKYVLALISFLIVIYYYISNGIPPFFSTSFFELGNDLIVQSRSNFLLEINNFWFFRLGFYYIPQIICSILYIDYLKNKSKQNMFKFYSYFIFSVILSLSFLHKTPIVILILQLFFIKIFVSKNIDFKTIIISSVFLFISMFSLYNLSFSGQLDISLGFILSALFQRIFAVYPLALSLVPDLVNHYGFFYGATIINPLGLFDFNQINLSHELHYLIYGFVANAPAPAIGYAYSDFGFLGVFFYVIIVNALIFTYQFLISFIKNNTIKLVFLCYMMTKALFLSMTSIFDSLLNPTDIFLFLIMISIYYINRYFGGELRNN